MRVQELGGKLEHEIAACRVAPDDDVGWGHAQVQQVLDGGNCLAQLLREGVFWYESCGKISNKVMLSHITRRCTIVEHGNPDSTLVLLTNGLEHVKVIEAGGDDISST
jgi:hypothetical protein